MRELPDLRHPALAARGKRPILAVYDGSAASKHAQSERMRRVACPAVVVP